MITKGRRWSLLFLGLGTLACFMVLLHQISREMPGVAGAMIENNQRDGLEVGAYFYSEVGELEEFLDDENGRYGRAQLLESSNVGE